MTTKTVKKTFEVIYNDLNETNKSLLRTAFLEEHGYTSFDTFYKKLRGDSSFAPNEKKWICAYLKISAEQIEFPSKN